MKASLEVAETALSAATLAPELEDFTGPSATPSRARIESIDMGDTTAANPYASVAAAAAVGAPGAASYPRVRELAVGVVGLAGAGSMAALLLARAGAGAPECDMHHTARPCFF